MLRVALVCPLKSAPLKRHWKRNGGVPEAVTLKFAVFPLVTIRLCGGTVMAGASKALVVEVTVLFAVTRSTSGLETETVFAMLPPAVTWTTSVILATAPLFSAPNEQVRTPPLWLQLPCVGAADTKLTPAGNESVNVTLEAADGPALLTVI